MCFSRIFSSGISYYVVWQMYAILPRSLPPPIVRPEDETALSPEILVNM
jgi:hypothetical protein